MAVFLTFSKLTLSTSSMDNGWSNKVVFCGCGREMVTMGELCYDALHCICCLTTDSIWVIHLLCRLEGFRIAGFSVRGW